jgi:hypothetical protein
VALGKTETPRKPLRRVAAEGILREKAETWLPWLHWLH